MNGKFDRYPNPKRQPEHPNIIEVQQIRDLCESCGVWIEDRCQGVVHHKDNNPENNEIWNLKRLCNSCHSKIHSHYPNWRFLTDDEIIQIIEDGIRILNPKSSISEIFIKSIEMRYNLKLGKDTEKIREKVSVEFSLVECRRGDNGELLR